MKPLTDKQKQRNLLKVAQGILDNGSPIELESGTYGEICDLKKRSCVGCALTALAVQHRPIRFFKSYEESGLMFGTFVHGFCEDNLMNGSEANNVISFFDNNDSKEYKPRYARLKTTIGKLKAICRNIIKNNGRFVYRDLKV